MEKYKIIKIRLLHFVRNDGLADWLNCSSIFVGSVAMQPFFIAINICKQQLIKC